MIGSYKVYISLSNYQEMPLVKSLMGNTILINPLGNCLGTLIAGVGKVIKRIYILKIKIRRFFFLSPEEKISF